MNFFIKDFIGKCAQIWGYLILDLLISSEDILDGKLDGKNIFRGLLINKNNSASDYLIPVPVGAVLTTKRERHFFLSKEKLNFAEKKIQTKPKA